MAERWSAGAPTSHPTKRLSLSGEEDRCPGASFTTAWVLDKTSSNEKDENLSRSLYFTSKISAAIDSGSHLEVTGLNKKSAVQIHGSKLFRSKTKRNTQRGRIKMTDGQAKISPPPPTCSRESLGKIHSTAPLIVSFTQAQMEARF